MSFPDLQQMAKNVFEIYQKLLQDINDFAGELEIAADISSLSDDSPRIKRVVLDLYAVMVQYWEAVPSMFKPRKIMGICLSMRLSRLENQRTTKY
jgi:hypothetical protein